MAGKDTRTLKRKRPKNPEPEEDLFNRISRKLHHDLKQVRRVAKKAKTFEIQRLVKKLKSVENNRDEEQKSLEEQLQLTKDLDHDSFATTVLLTKIKKDSILSRHETVRNILCHESFSTKVFFDPITPGTTLARVHARALSSKALAKMISDIIHSLREVLDGDVSKKVKHDDQIHEKALEKKTDPIPPKPLDQYASGESGNNEDGDRESDRYIEAGTSGNDRYAPASSPHVSPDDDGDDWDSQSFQGDGEDDVSDDAPSSQKSRSEARLEQPPIPRAISKYQDNADMERPKLMTAQASSSRFLPTLQTGFARGDDSGSDWEDNASKAIDGPVKKNRRGQRARQAIWEKKYGRGANHVKKRQEEEVNLRKAKEEKRAAREQKLMARQATGGQSNKPDVGWAGRQKSAPVEVIRNNNNNNNNNNDKGERLHPSWVAKKAMKEKQSMTIVPSQGKKIKFD